MSVIQKYRVIIIVNGVNTSRERERGTIRGGMVVMKLKILSIDDCYKTKYCRA